jgi:DNA-binding MarR family transcriptional regulator
MSERIVVTEHANGPVLPCVCTTVRRADRLLNRIYDDALRPSGLATTQYAILATLSRANGSLSHSQLARKQEMAGTTLSRTLKPLLRDDLVAMAPGADRRTRLVTITERGEEVLAQARPLWRAAQERVLAEVGSARAAQLIDELGAVIATLREA